MNQLKLDLILDQNVYTQYKLNLPYQDLVNTDPKKDFMIRRYLQLQNIDVPVTVPDIRSLERTDLKDLEAGASYFEIKDFYQKFDILKSVLVPADDVLIIYGQTNAKRISRWSNYTVSINWYIQNWGTMYQFFQDDQLVDQFRPDDYTLWAIDLNEEYQIVNLDYPNKDRVCISWLYKDCTMNELLADWTSFYK